MRAVFFLIPDLNPSRTSSCGCRYVWASKADGNFEVYEDTDSEPLGRGTEIRIHLKEEAGEYLSETKLKVRMGMTVW